MSSECDQPQGGKVLWLTRRARAAQKIDRIEEYWNTVRGTRLVPSRSEIDPRGLDGVLGNAFVLERITGGLARFRISGSHLTDLIGLELRQMPISALFLPGAREVLAGALEAVFDEPATVRMEISSPGIFGREALSGEMILLPLRSDLGDIDRVLGGIVLDGRVGRTPRRIEIIDESRKSLTGFAGKPQKTGVKDAHIQPRRPALPTRALLPRPGPVPKISRGHLRLVVSNDEI